jgi:hypothetical protein
MCIVLQQIDEQISPIFLVALWSNKKSVGFFFHVNMISF